MLQQLVDKAVSPRRFIVLLLGGFALNQRTQEICIPLALGASAADLQAGIVRQTLGLAAIGMLFGGAASWALARALGGLLYGITPRDPATFLGVLMVRTGVAAIAGYVPARRASRIDPSLALRAS